MILARSMQGLVALIVDDVEDVVLVDADSMQAPSSVYELADKMIAVCRLESGLVFLLDIDALVVPVVHAVEAMSP
jgi:chemotaxis signal transduction protein